MNHGRRRLFSDQNPFSTACVKPGAMAYQFGAGISAEGLVAELKQNHWRGEIVGPHGSGKSTLLQELLPVIEAAGREVRSYTAKSRDRQFRLFTATHTAWTTTTQVVIEGYELLSRRDQKLLDRLCREQCAGLLITCHQPQGLPPLFATSITLELAISLVKKLLGDADDIIAVADVGDSFSRHGQNVRELLFEMYDLYEQRRESAEHAP